MGFRSVRRALGDPIAYSNYVFVLLGFSDVVGFRILRLILKKA